jgi:hypothetical protein
MANTEQPQTALPRQVPAGLGEASGRTADSRKWGKRKRPGSSGSHGIARVVPQVDALGNSGVYTFEKVKYLTRATMKVTQVLEDSPARFWVAFDGKTGVMGDQERLYRVHWYVVVPSNPVCAMDVFFDVAEKAKLIALSLQGAK